MSSCRISTTVGVAQSIKTRRNELAKWRMIARLLGVDVAMTATKNESSLQLIDETCLIVRKLSPELLACLMRDMYREHYSINYMYNVWRSIQTINRHATKSMFWHIVDEEHAAAAANFSLPPSESSRRSSQKSDGRLTFNEVEYRNLRRVVCSTIDKLSTVTATATAPHDQCLFLYVFYMLSITGKRLSDIASINSLKLQQLRTRGVCIVNIRKTGGLGRIEIPELLSTTDDQNDESSAIMSKLDVFLHWCKSGALNIPFECITQRHSLDRHLSRLYTQVCGSQKARGLSFHALRRIYAGYRYLHGVSVERLRENLDHASRRQTNVYVNNCLAELI